MELSPNATDADIAEWSQRQEFVRDATPNRWIDYSLELQEAATTLWSVRGNSMEVTLLQRVDAANTLSRQIVNPRVFVLLAGLALENSLKGQLVVEQPAFITDARLHKPLKTHGLLDLMDRIKTLTFDTTERSIAKTCEAAIPYWGRYPVPLDYTGRDDEDQVPDEFHDQFVALNRRIRKSVYDSIRDGWDSGVGPKIIMIRSKECDDDLELDKPLP